LFSTVGTSVILFRFLDEEFLIKFRAINILSCCKFYFKAC